MISRFQSIFCCSLRQAWNWINVNLPHINASTLLLKAGNKFTPISQSSSPVWHRSNFLCRNYQQTWRRHLSSRTLCLTLSRVFWKIGVQCSALCPLSFTLRGQKSSAVRSKYWSRICTLNSDQKQRALVSLSVCRMSSTQASPSDLYDGVIAASPCVLPQHPLGHRGSQRWAETCPALQGSH